jgi:hypothetical protein
MRVSIGIHMEDLESAFETYHLMSQKWFTHATPTLFNSGTRAPQMSSCFLLKMQEDSIEGNFLINFLKIFLFERNKNLINNYFLFHILF